MLMFQSHVSIKKCMVINIKRQQYQKNSLNKTERKYSLKTMNNKIMKQKSFILRSSSIKSKQKSIFTPIVTQQHSLSSIDRFPTIQQPNSQTNFRKQLQQKDRQLEQRLSKLTLNLKSIEKQYKQNLKQGFQSKIKSYRLQTVMERKLMKQTIQETLEMNQLQEIKEKRYMALKMKQFAENNQHRKNQIKHKQLQRIRQNHQTEQRKINYSITLRQMQLQTKNRSLHDKIVKEQRHKDRKKNYLEYYRQQKLKKDEFQLKKEFLQKIVTNARKIKGLQEELQTVENRCEQFLATQDDIKWKDRGGMFVTI